MHGPMGPGLLPEDSQGLGIFENFNESGVHVGGPPVHAPGGSRGSKAPKSRKDEEDDDKYTTVMLRNIPNKYTRGMLIEQLHRTGFRRDIDYLYLPTDFTNRCNVGYCFVNLRTPLARARFTNQFDGVAAQSCLPGFNSYKVCQVTRAKWQGRDENVRRLRSGPELMAQLAAHPEWLPLLLDEEGNQEPFLCDEEIAAAQGPTAPRRQTRKRQGQGPQGQLAGLGRPGSADGWTLGLDGLVGAGFPGMAGGGRGAGGGAGDRGPGRRRRGGGCMDGSSASGSYGVPMSPMPVPVMTEQGLQYMPYEAAYGEAGGYFLAAYPAMAAEQQMFGMPYTASYPGFPGYGWAEGNGPGMDFANLGAWPRQQRGRRRNGGGSADVAAAEPEEDGGTDTQD